MNPLAGIAVVLAALGALMLGVRGLQARGRVGAESARKLVHMGMGVVCLAFPWLFESPLPVWTLAALAGAALGALRIVRPLRRALGGVLHDVNRASFGEVYFPLGVAAVFTLAQGSALRFVVPVAMLTFADAAGALIGKRWGRHRFQTLEGCKSVEGSLAVGTVAFVCVFVPLMVAGVSWATAVLAGAVMGLFALLLEAISWRGLDNIFLPLAAFVQISVYLRATPDELATRLAVLGAMTLVAITWRRGKLVDDSARLGGALALYFFWVVGGWPWLVAPVVLAVSYVRLMPTVPGGLPRHDLMAVICVASAGMVWAVAAAFAPDPRWVWPFTLGIAMHQAVIAIVRFSQGRPHWPRMAWWAIGTAQAVSMHLLAFWLADRGRTLGGAGLAGGAACLALAAAAFTVWEQKLQMPDDLNARWWKQGTAALAASTAGFYLMHA